MVMRCHLYGLSRLSIIASLFYFAFIKVKNVCKVINNRSNAAESRFVKAVTCHKWSVPTSQPTKLVVGIVLPLNQSQH